MRLSIEYRSASSDIHVITGSGGNVRVFGKSTFVYALCSLNHLVQPGCNFRRRHAPAKNVRSRHGRAVEVAIGIFALDKRGALQ